jgi:radical SAM protein with 4Fe4S-binding SPASM domain
VALLPTLQKTALTAPFREPMREVYRTCKTGLSTVAAQYRYWKLVRGARCLSDLKIVSIEFCSVCNLACRYCDLQKLDRPPFLDLGIFRKLIDEISDTTKYGIEIMEWPISGEFLLHPEHEAVVRYTREAMDRNPRFRPWVILNDNMMLLDEAKARFLLEAGVLSQIICSIDGRDKASFEYMRKRGKYEIVMANTERLVDMNIRAGHPLVIQINNGCDATCKDTPRDPRLQRLFGRVDHVRYWEPVDFNESFHGEQPDFKPARGFCTFVFNSVTLSSSGQILKCCMDLQERTKYGDFTRESLDAIWHGAMRKELLGHMYRNRRDQVSGCANCAIGMTDNNNKYDRKRLDVPAGDTPT